MGVNWRVIPRELRIVPSSQGECKYLLWSDVGKYPSKPQHHLISPIGSKHHCSALTSMHMHMRARYFVITSKSTWTSTVTLMARAHGFATSEMFVIDIDRKANRLAELAETGCWFYTNPKMKGI